MPLSPHTLERFRDGDSAAFAEVVRSHTPLVRSLAARFFTGEFEREEAMQEVWVHAWRNRTSLDLGRVESFSGWLAVLARRRCLDLLRSAANPAEPGPEEPDALLRWLEEAPTQLAGPEAEELRGAVEAFKKRLRPGWREFFELHFVEGLEYGDVASRLGISKLRCKYMKKVLAAKARRDPALRDALGRSNPAARESEGGRDAL